MSFDVHSASKLSSLAHGGYFIFSGDVFFFFWEKYGTSLIERGFPRVPLLNLD